MSPAEPPKLELGDYIAMRNMLADQMVEYFQDAGYTIDFTWDNRKLMSMALACTIALGTHFNGMEFPDNWWIVLLCACG